MENLLLLKLNSSPFTKKFGEITQTVKFLDHTLMPGIVNEFVNNFDY
jgi:hypothetical protein